MAGVNEVQDYGGHRPRDTEEDATVGVRVLYCVALFLCSSPAYSGQIAVQCQGIDAPPLRFNGRAGVMPETSALRLTSNGISQAGSVFTPEPLYIGCFDTTFSFMLHGSEEHADGLTFCIQNDPKGFSALGSLGGYLGYGTSDFWDTAGISRSVAVEFDDYYNDEFRDLPTDHIGIDIQGSVVSKAQAATPVPIVGESVKARVTYDGTMLSVFVWSGDQQPAAPFLSYAVDIPAIVGSSQAYVGFTGATATYFQFTDVTSWRFGARELVPWRAPVAVGDADAAEL